MDRKPRIDYKSAAYRVMSRGNRGENILVDDEDRRLFLEPPPTRGRWLR